MKEAPPTLSTDKTPAPKATPTEASATSAPAKLKPVTVNDFLDQTRGFIGQQDFNSARVLASDCVARHPDAPQCHLVLSVLQARLRNLQASAYHYEQFVRLTPEGDSTRSRVIELLYASDFNPASYDVAALLGLLIEEPSGDASRTPAPPRRSDRDWVKLFYKRAAAHFKGGQKYEALGPASMCVLLDPKHAGCHLILGDCYQSIYKRKQSQEHYLMFLSLAPQNHPARARVSALTRH
ncbi:hypothetical protein HMI49_42110 [Corallococcus exercitus]|uniref:Tetratricopeptide repeat protein n=1 Tax=Corallococcus exercitus TaxID=2316736 RepID=A0A7Y4KTZ2_9BACT|nr:hypothetical protein [Corallococcus exercitus]